MVGFPPCLQRSPTAFARARLIGHCFPRIQRSHFSIDDAQPRNRGLSKSIGLNLPTLEPDSSFGYVGFPNLANNPIAAANINAKKKTKTAFPRRRLIAKPRGVSSSG